MTKTLFIRTEIYCGRKFFVTSKQIYFWQTAIFPCHKENCQESPKIQYLNRAEVIFIV